MRNKKKCFHSPANRVEKTLLLAFFRQIEKRYDAIIRDIFDHRKIYTRSDFKSELFREWWKSSTDEGSVSPTLNLCLTSMLRDTRIPQPLGTELLDGLSINLVFEPSLPMITITPFFLNRLKELAINYEKSFVYD
ncbi:MAG: hypothetical protein KAH07_02500 [Flavobacteriaceae bacterium]|nr:hypothetical protein [Flavobacteriaceae bacterium]